MMSAKELLNYSEQEMKESRGQRLNVLWLVDHLGQNGVMHGAGKYYLYTIPLFDASRFKVTLCALRSRDNLTHQFQKRGINVLHLGRRKLDPLTLFDIIKIIQNQKIHLLHAHGYGSANFGRLAGTICGIPRVIHAHDEDSNYPWYQRLSDSLLRRFTDEAIAISQAVKESCIKNRKIPEDRVLVMHNGIPLEQFKTPGSEQIEAERRRLGIGPNFRVVGTVAKLREEKGIEYLLESVPKVLAACPDTIFVLVGDGPLRIQLESLCRRLNIDQNVVFAGYQGDVSKVFSILDIKVLPSVTEGFGLVIAEAMAMGKPIIATNVGGIKEILKDGETGLLVPARDAQALAGRIIYLLKNEEESKRLGTRAKQESRKYDINLYVRTLEEHYLELALWACE